MDVCNELLANGRLDELYSYIVNNKVYNLDANATVDEKFLLVSHPEDYKPIKEIYGFICRGGVELWRALANNDIDHVSAWIKNGGDPEIVHPINGNTMVHENYDLCMKLNIDNIGDILLFRNYNGLEAIVQRRADDL